MRTALYFPHTEVRSKNVMHSSLLLWDSLEYIVPFRGYRPNYRDRDMGEAMEIIGQSRCPSKAEKLRVHELMEDLLRGGTPETFFYSPRSGKTDYDVWPQKLAPETWDLLVEHRVTNRYLGNHDYPMSQAAGLSLMAVLADVLAGSTRARITDRDLAYATIANAVKVAQPAGDVIRVVPLTLKGIAVDRIPFDRLIAYRKREARESGGDYRKLRHNYQQAVETHVAKIATVDPHSPDREELDRAFRSDMEDDLADLKKELGFAKRDAWLSKDVVALVVAGGGLLGAAAGLPGIPIPQVVGLGGGAALLAGLLGSGNKLAKARYDVLRKHPMAYLHELSELRA
ncbi:hypothetical protein ASF69_16590 [Rhizobium sp. Leaf311]|uniref:hypothetical protein n=1 Tax=Rhizobium sp. Leaf311 TaxID=1736332 RepID=UPI00071409C9|nr:hypothetical protein [Rhizobium sp. Leaf311]KQQ56386.1 hypothetical protein ASF69_16590 [Rhizobium sp. Leaf311]